MSASGHYRRVLPRDPEAEPVCLLTREWAERRQEPVHALLADATAEIARPDGIEYRFPARPEVWGRLDTFIEEEGECCPFLAFEVVEEAGEAVLRVLQPEAPA
jgi:hypothetical protein